MKLNMWLLFLSLRLLSTIYWKLHGIQAMLMYTEYPTFFPTMNPTISTEMPTMMSMSMSMMTASNTDPRLLGAYYEDEDNKI